MTVGLWTGPLQLSGDSRESILRSRRPKKKEMTTATVAILASIAQVSVELPRLRATPVSTGPMVLPMYVPVWTMPVAAAVAQAPCAR